jgi:molybdopterin-guanine dinucleotide biosynthesis protein A
MGIMTCLEHSQNELNVILSYDMPLIEPRLILDLLKYSEEFDIVLPATRIDQPQPLCGIYKKSILPVIKEAYKNGLKAPRQLIPLVNSRIHMVEKSTPYYTQDMFLSINTQEDIRRITQQY